MLRRVSSSWSFFFCRFLRGFYPPSLSFLFSSSSPLIPSQQVCPGSYLCSQTFQTVTRSRSLLPSQAVARPLLQLWPPAAAGGRAPSSQSGRTTRPTGAGQPRGEGNGSGGARGSSPPRPPLPAATDALLRAGRASQERGCALGRWVPLGYFFSPQEWLGSGSRRHPDRPGSSATGALAESLNVRQPAAKCLPEGQARAHRARATDGVERE